MKKLITIAVVAALTCMALATITACGQQGQASSSSAAAESSQAATSEFATLGDIFAAETQDMQSTFDEQHYACAFSLDGTWWRAEADLENGMFDKLNEVWTEDQAKVEELLAPLAVKTAEILEAPSADEIAAYIGKKGADLTADGFEFMAGGVAVNGDQTDCTVSKDSFDYLVTFDGAIANEDTEDPAADVADLTVADISIQGLSWSALEGV